MRDKQDRNLDIDAYKHIYYHGISGAHLYTLYEEVQFIKNLSVDIVLLEIGSNDLCNSHTDPNKLAWDIINFAHVLIDTCGIRKVLLSKILYRTRVWKLAQYQRDLVSYHSAVRITNGILQVFCHTTIAEQLTKGVILCKHKGLWENYKQFICDGIHPNLSGLRCICNSYRRAFILAAHYL